MNKEVHKLKPLFEPVYEVYMSVQQYADYIGGKIGGAVHNAYWDAMSVYDRWSDGSYVNETVSRTCPVTGAHLTLKRHGALIKVTIRGYAYNNLDAAKCCAYMKGSK